MISKLIILLAVGAALAAEDSNNLNNVAERFLVRPVTRTTTTTTTVVQATSVTTFCASLFNVTGACRKRRDVQDQFIAISLDDDIDIQDILASPPVPLETTAGPNSHLHKRDLADESDRIQSSMDLVNVEVRGLNSLCQGRTGFPFFGFGNTDFGITVYFTTTVTATATSFTAGNTVTRTFVVQKCTPAGFLFKTC